VQQEYSEFVEEKTAELEALTTELAAKDAKLKTASD